MPVPARALLLVYTELGHDVRPSAYERWHDTEHVWPLLNLPGPLFLSATRYQAADGRTPAHLALYDLASPTAVHDSAYLDLVEPDKESESDDAYHDERAGRRRTRMSAHERHAHNILEHVEHMERRVYEPLADQSRASTSATMPSTASDGSSDDDSSDDMQGEPGRYLSITEIELEKYAESEFNRWFDEEHIPLLTRVPGWVRSRRYVLKEVVSGTDHGSDTAAIDAETERAPKRVGGYGRGKEVKEGRPPKYLALHEWTSIDAFLTKEFKRATSTPWRAQVLKEEGVLRYEMRVFRVVRNWGRFET